MTRSDAAATSRNSRSALPNPVGRTWRHPLALPAGAFPTAPPVIGHRGGASWTSGCGSKMAAMAKVLVGLVGCLLVATTAYAGEAFRDSKQFKTAEAFRNCSLAQKVDPRTLTDAGKQAARGCVGLGMAYESGDRVDESGKPIPVNYTLAAQYYGIACNLTVAFGCVSMGKMIEDGHATGAKGKDPREVALGWYAKGCFA